jgi:hypothetical protein
MSDADPEFPDAWHGEREMFYEKIEGAEPAYVDDDLHGGDSVVIGRAYSGESLLNTVFADTRSPNVFRDIANDKAKKGKKDKVAKGRISDLELRIAQLKKELKRLKDRPNEPTENGNIISFHKQFSGGGTVYSYAAIKAAGLWYTTGPKSPKGYSWDELLDFIGDNEIYLVTSATPLVGG